jgi:hypothetical protein
MRIAITGIRDGLLVLGLGLLLCVFLVGAFTVADKYHTNVLWVAFAWASFLMIPALLRAFRGHLKRRFIFPFLALLAIIHGLVFAGLMKWQVSLAYWFPIFAAELSLGAWAAYRFFGVIPSGDI